jgi:hypothetical protein
MDIMNSCYKHRPIKAVVVCVIGKVAAGAPRRHRPLLSRRKRHCQAFGDKTPLTAAGSINRSEGISIIKQGAVGFPNPGTAIATSAPVRTPSR